MRQLSKALLLEQQKSSVTPFVRVPIGSGGATEAFYPDADPENTCGDWEMIYYDYLDGVSWSNMWNGITDGLNSILSWYVKYINITINSEDDANMWYEMSRVQLVFDVSGATAGVLSSAKLSLGGRGVKIDEAGWLPSYNIYSSSPPRNTGPAGGDDEDFLRLFFNGSGSTPYCDTAINFADWEEDYPDNYNEFAFNATGLAAVQAALDGDGIVKLSVREVNYDVANVAPAWVAYKRCSIGLTSADEGGDRIPKLELTYPGIIDNEKIISVLHYETPDDNYAEILLDNSDQAHSGQDYRGTKIQLGWGLTIE